MIVLGAPGSNQENTYVLTGFPELETMDVVDAKFQDYSDSDVMQHFDGVVPSPIERTQ